MRYISWVLDKTISGEPMALKITNKINGKLKFLYRKNVSRKRASQNALQCWYPNLNKKKRKLNDAK